jgi:RyR domain/MoxR domain in the MoxR-vWA-beta-propeller ternary systems
MSMDTSERRITFLGVSTPETQVFGAGSAAPVRVRNVRGGIARLASLVSAAAAAPEAPAALGASVRVGDVRTATGLSSTVALYSPRPRSADRWSLREQHGQVGALTELPPLDGAPEADLLVIDAWGVRVMGASARSWAPGAARAILACLPGPDEGAGLARLLRSAEWETLTQLAGDGLTAIVEADSLRSLEVVLSKGMSWERTALELVHALETNPSMAVLCRCRNLVVRFDLEGTLHVALDARNKVADARLFYDPALREGGLRLSRDWPGDVPGAEACLAASLALRLSTQDAPGAASPGAIAAGIQCGLAAARLLVSTGFSAGEPTDSPEGAFAADGLPYDALARTLLGAFAPLPVASIPVDVGSVGPLSAQQAESWSILGNSRTLATDEGRPLLSMGQRLAEFGPAALFDIPREEIGSFLTVDRAEIESIRAIVHLVEVYDRSDRGERPLSLGVFGPPGAGKSFAVKQVAKRLLGTGPLEFNLSQFEGPRDLVGALHRVREAVLSSPGRTPLVFWDEFDSRGYAWLQLLLAPMQDGRFQDGQQSYSLGKSIFVFAGGTAHSFDRFGAFAGAGREEQEQAFRLAKGPDFKSRLHGALDVLGPNRRERWVSSADGGTWQADPADVAFPLRRALLLRGQLGVGPAERLFIDQGLLGALLEIPRYEHGSRSFERVVYHLRHGARDGVYRRSDLPVPALLAGHVDGGELIRRAAQALPLVRILHELAQACHAAYLDQVGEAHYRMAFDDLPPAIQADNHAAASRITRVLERAGLVIVEKGSPAELKPEEVARLIEAQIETLAEAEHDGWRSFKEACGWRVGHRTKARELLDLQNNLLVPYAELAEAEKDKDRNAVRNYPRIVALGGWGLASVVTDESQAVVGT